MGGAGKESDGLRRGNGTNFCCTYGEDDGGCGRVAVMLLMSCWERGIMRGARNERFALVAENGSSQYMISQFRNFAAVGTATLGGLVKTVSANY